MEPPADHIFAMKAAQGGMAEVQLGKLAAERGENPKVKEFGTRMVTDHTQINDQFKSLAASKGITLPDRIDAKDEATMKHLDSLHGVAFDRAYMEDMVNDHRQDIAEFEREANHGTDSDIKAFASKTLPTLQEHLKMAEQALTDVRESGR